MKKLNSEQLEIVLFKYAVIHDFLYGPNLRGRTTQLIKELVKKEFRHPRSDRIVKLSSSTIYRYLRAYREKGTEGLEKKIRRDKGKLKAFGQEVLDFAIKLRKELSSRSTETIIEILKNELGDLKIAPSTLNFHLHRAGYSKKQMKNCDTGTFGRFESSAPNVLWIGDYHDKNGLLVNGREVHLAAFIDCKTRYILQAEYYYRENLWTLEDSFKKAVLKNGCPHRVYLDNAKIFHSKRFEYCCIKLNIDPPIFSKPYVSESRGKIERWFGYVKSNFEAEIMARGGCSDIEELNELFKAFVELKYNNRVHSETGLVPAVEFSKHKDKRYPDINILNELFMLSESRTVHKKTKTVSVLHQLFLTDAWLGGKKVEVHYNPCDLSYVLIYYNKKFIMKAMPFEVNKKIKNTENKEEPDQNFKYDYLLALKGKYYKMLKENAVLTKCSGIKMQSGRPFDVQDFILTASEMLKKKFSDYDKTNLRKFFDSYRPENRETVVQAIVYSREKFGGNKHINFYLDFVKFFIFAKRGESK